MLAMRGARTGAHLAKMVSVTTSSFRPAVLAVDALHSSSRSYSDEAAAYVAPSQFSNNLQEHITSSSIGGNIRGPLKKRGPRPKVFAEYRASTVIRGRVARKAPGGNISKFKVTTVVGNGKGWAGVGDAQSTYSGREARTKAIVDAMKGMFYIERYRGKTVYHGVKTKLGATKVDLWPKREGSGVHAGLIASKLLQRLGITDVGVKIRGSRNKTMQLKATVKALSMIESHEAAAKRRGVMLPRLSYHDYRRVCAEQEAEMKQGAHFAEVESWSDNAGMPVAGMHKLQKNMSLKRRSTHRKVAFYQNQKDQLLHRLGGVRARTDTPIMDRVMEEMQDFQRELWEVSEARETFRLEQEAQWEQELLEMEEQGLHMDGKKVSAAELDRLEQREEAEEAVFQMYASRVVSGDVAERKEDVAGAAADGAAAAAAAATGTGDSKQPDWVADALPKE